MTTAELSWKQTRPRAGFVNLASRVRIIATPIEVPKAIIEAHSRTTQRGQQNLQISDVTNASVNTPMVF